MVKPNPSCTTPHDHHLRQVKTYPPTTAKQTYTIAHTAQCKLNMAANQPDRNLRFVLGHAFTLDNVLLRIVEIENMAVKERSDKDSSNRNVLEGAVENEDDDDDRIPVPGGKDQVDVGGVQVAETGSLARRVSFSDNEARPSKTLSSGGDSQKKKSRARSPPPTSLPRAAKDDDDDAASTSSDDYDDPGTGLTMTTSKGSKAIDKPTYSDDEGDDADDDDDGLGLTRFASASAAPPRMVPSSEDDSDSDDEGPVSPPSLPADVDIHDVLGGQEDVELGELYEAVRGCPCHGEVGLHSQGLWDVPVQAKEEEKKMKTKMQGQEKGQFHTKGRLAVMRVGA